MYLFCILFFFYSCYNAEEVILLSQNGTVFASKGQYVNLTCKTDMNSLISIRFKKPNVNIADSPYLRLRKGNCFPPENFTCDRLKNEFTYNLQQSDYDNGDTWSCRATNSSQVYIQSSFITITTIESISSITMTLPTGNTTVMNVNTVGIFECETSLSRPEAEILWYKTLINGTEIQLLNGSSLDVMANASMSWTKSTFKYTATESDNGVRIQCRGRLPQVPTDEPNESKEVLLYIRYPPYGQPQTNNDGSVTVKDGLNIEIQCYILGGNPLANLSWNCNGNKIQGINRHNETTFRSILLLQATSTLNGKTCVCIATHQLMTERTVSTDLNILFEPQKKINISSTHVGYINASSYVTLTCVVNGGNPVANLTWGCNDIYTRSVNTYLADKVISTITFQVEKENNGKTCTCTANHSLWDQIIQEHTTLNVSFAPDTNLVITGASTVFYENDTMTLICSLSNGNPLAKLTFNCWQTIYGVDKSNSTAAVSVISSTAMPSGNNEICKCTAEHILLQTNLEKNVQTTIFYPPTKPSLIFTPSQPLLEGQDVDVLCNAIQGNPRNTSYTWTLNDVFVATTNKILKLINITKDINQQSLKCTVRNAFTDNKNQVIESNTDQLNVHYRPRIFQINKTVTTIEGMTISQSCVAMGNPVPKVQWFQGIRETSTENAGNSNLNLVNISRDQQGNYYCKATAESTLHGQLESTFNVSIVVNYPPDVSIYVERNNLSVDSSVKLFCNATGQPDNYNFTGWHHSFHNKEIRNKDEMQIYVNGSYLLLPKLSYQDIGNYSCFVDNGIKNRNGLLTQTNSIDIAVNGFPIKIPTTPTYPIFTAEQRSPLIARLLFYTFPNITDFQWYNLTTGSEISRTVVDTNISKTTLKYELYGHQVDFSNFAYEALFMIGNFQHYHEGSYSLVVSNMERMSNFTFRAQISGPPESPLYVNVSEKTYSAITLFLVSGFNGGHDQMFHVVYHVLNHEEMLHEQPFADQNTEPQFLKISNLIPSTTYKLSVFASNEKGNSTLNETLCCRIVIVQTDEKTEVQPDRQTIQLEGLAAGLAVAVFTVISIILIVVFLRRRIPLFSKGREDNGRLKLTANAKNDEGEDGLKDNILYESAGPGFERKNCSSSTEYAMVQKKGDRFKTNGNEDNQKETGLYSVVNKKPKAKMPADVCVNASGDKKGKDKFKNKKNTNHSAIEDVYENMSDESRMKGNDNSVKTIRNNDGLQYAELVFNPLSNGPKFVIHGLEDRTIYAIVDTTQKIDPLPDSDDEEDKQSASSKKQDE